MTEALKDLMGDTAKRAEVLVDSPSGRSGPRGEHNKDSSHATKVGSGTSGRWRPPQEQASSHGKGSWYGKKDAHESSGRWRPRDNNRSLTSMPEGRRWNRNRASGG